jgi:hypothetical protein
MPFVVEPCTQPECLLWEEGVDCGSVAELVVRILSGEDVSNAMTEKSPIQPHEHCVNCVLRVMRGGEPGVEERIRVGPSRRFRSPRRTREQILAHWQD